MASITDQDKPLGLARRMGAGLAAGYDALGRLLSAPLPKGLYTRSLIIIVAPIVLLQGILAAVFMDRHWEFVTKRLSAAIVSDIAMLIDLDQALAVTSPDRAAERVRLVQLARKNLGLTIAFLPENTLPPAGPKRFFGFVDRTISKSIAARVDRPFWIDTVGETNFLEVRIKLDDGIMQVVMPRKQAYASNTHIFIMWMVGTSVVLLVVSILFLRNQIKPIVRLADAANRFGKGQPVPQDFRPRGAREVRQAAQAFLEMRDRIERHVEQRTTMLAGVSHDLRTVLTRFRLQLAMVPDQVSVTALHGDVREMQAMLDDYMAFARGDNGELPSRTDVVKLMHQITEHAGQIGIPVTLDCKRERMVVSLRRQAFKRAVENLVSNAGRYGDQVVVRLRRVDRMMRVEVEDNGPGIPENEYDNVFKPFYRIDRARNQDHGHSGLGLAIARDVARSHGGDIRLGRSALGGLKATLEMPL